MYTEKRTVSSESETHCQCCTGSTPIYWQYLPGIHSWAFNMIWWPRELSTYSSTCGYHWVFPQWCRCTASVEAERHSSSLLGPNSVQDAAGPIIGDIIVGFIFIFIIGILTIKFRVANGITIRAVVWKDLGQVGAGIGLILFVVRSDRSGVRRHGWHSLQEAGKQKESLSRR